MLFAGIARDLELYTTEEVMSLRSAGILKSPSGASLSLSKLSSLTSLAQIQSAPTTPKVTPGSPKVELDSSSKKRNYTSSSKIHKHPVSVAAGSSASLEKSYEQDHDTECRWREDKGHNKNHERSRECEDHACLKGKSSHHEHASGQDCGRASKHGRSAEPGSSFKGMMTPQSKQIMQSWVQMLSHTRMHMPSATSDLSFYSNKLTLYVCQFKCWSLVIQHESGVSSSCWQRELWNRDVCTTDGGCNSREC